MKRYIFTSLMTFIYFIFFTNSGFLNAQDKDPYILKPVGDEAYLAIFQFYQYDKIIPLEVKTLAKEYDENYIKEKIVFTGIRDSRVPGFIAIPRKGNPPYPCIIQIHGHGGSKSNWWKDDSYIHGGLVSEKLLSSGYAVLSLDLQYHGERALENDFESPTAMIFEKGKVVRFRNSVVQSAIEHRRAIDYLETRKDIDTTKIGVIGYSLGGLLTFIITGIDTRIKTSVACVTPTMKPQPLVPKEENISGIAAHTFARSATIPFLMLMGTKDDLYTKDEANQLLKLIKSDKKDLIFYESGHRLPKAYVDKAVKWFTDNL